MPSPNMLLIDKTGVVKTVGLPREMADLYKKAGFKSPIHFECHHIWKRGDQSFSLYGKKTGRANQENKYEFPPPMDNVLFFGSCLLVCHSLSTHKVVDISVKEWEKIYNELFGGFEDLCDSDMEVEDMEEESEEDIEKTTTGYAKDGFVVDDDEADEMEEEEDADDSDSDAQLQSAKRKHHKNKYPPRAVIAPMLESSSDAADTFLECTSELSEEEYI